MAKLMLFGLRNKKPGSARVVQTPILQTKFPKRYPPFTCTHVPNLVQIGLGLLEFFTND